MLHEVTVRPVPLAPYQLAFGTHRAEQLRSAAVGARQTLAGRTVWMVNSTAGGGGVAELLNALVPLARAYGLDVRWLVIDGDAPFWAITKRLCTRIYGAEGDGGPLAAAELRHYRAVTADNAVQLARFVRAGDVVVLHEAHPAGLVNQARRLGAHVVYRGHTGNDEPNEWTRDGWAFLRRFVEQADATVFLTAALVPGWAPRPRVIPPSIDPCGPKNVALTAGRSTQILCAVGILQDPGIGGDLPVRVPIPVGEDVVVQRPAIVVREGPAPSPDTPMVVQVSRWDRLKDMSGVLRAFVQADVAGSHLTLAGADVAGVSDDPEAAEIFEECRQAWAQLPPEHRRRVQLVCLPMADLRENAVVVNALQQHATVVVQKSLAEGFGLTATEAMWKSRPVVASAVGGLREQVLDGETGILVGPHDLAATATAVRNLLRDSDLAARLGAGGRRRVQERFLPDRHLLDWAQLIGDLVGGAGQTPNGFVEEAEIS